MARSVGSLRRFRREVMRAVARGARGLPPVTPPASHARVACSGGVHAVPMWTASETAATVADPGRVRHRIERVSARALHARRWLPPPPSGDAAAMRHSRGNGIEKKGLAASVRMLRDSGRPGGSGSAVVATSQRFVSYGIGAGGAGKGSDPPIAEVDARKIGGPGSGVKGTGSSAPSHPGGKQTHNDAGNSSQPEIGCAEGSATGQGGNNQHLGSGAAGGGGGDRKGGVGGNGGSGGGGSGNPGPEVGSGRSSGGGKEGSGGGGKGGSGGGGGWGGANQALVGQIAAAALVMGGLSMLNSRNHGKEISFQSFVWGLLANGLVERVEVVNRTTARVFLRPGANWESINLDNIQQGTQYDDSLNRHGDPEASDIVRDSPSDEAGGSGEPSYPGLDRRSGPGWESPRSSGTAGLPQRDAPYYFNIGTVDTFDRKLQAVQEDMGIKPDDFVPVTYVNESNIFAELARHFPTLLLLIAAAFTMRNALGSIGGGIGGRGGIFQVGKANPTIFKAGEAGAPETTFKDVAGLDEAKTEVMEFVDFLKNPGRYEKLGAKIPKGALLQGPPGCGKTLLAKATAGEASVPFFSISGSDFIEMFVGVGPSRVRDLFAQARANAPCIVFIDEIDAVGRARGRGGFSGGNDERENTLNALLVEMDGFTSSTGVVVLAGTNRADILDKALLRPGRFDRQITIDKPDMRGRFEIYMVHLQPLKLQADPSFIAKRLAALTPGFAGADIANICNEAALIAARHEKNAVELVDFEQATDRVIGGLEKKNKVISKKEREIVAHHEAGHATAGWFLKHADPLIKVSIIPRGTAALGFAQYLPVDKFLQSRDQLRDFMIMALGGRVAEKLCFGSITTGAQDDLVRVTRAVYAQITNFGMSEKVGKVYFPRAGEAGAGSQFFKPYSERTAEMIDEEAMQMVDEAYQACEKLLAEKLDTVKALAARLLEKEVIGEEDLVEILGHRPFAKPVDYDSFVGRFDADRRNRTGRDNSDKKDPSAKDGATTPPIPVAGVEDNGSADGRKAGKPGESGRKKPSHVDQDEPIPELA